MLQYRQIRTLKRSAHADAITCLAISPSGRFVASGGVDHAVRVSSVEDGKLHFSVYTPEPISALCWLPDCTRDLKMVVACRDGMIINATHTPQKLVFQYFRVYQHAIDHIAVDSTGHLLATGAGSDIRVWSGAPDHDWNDVKHFGRPQLSGDILDAEVVLTGLHWRRNHQGQSVLIATYKHHGIQIWELTSEVPSRHVGSGATIFKSSLSPNGRNISVAKDRVYDVYDISSGIVVQTLSHHFKSGEHCAVHYVHGEEGLCICRAPGSVDLMDPTSGESLQDICRMGHDSIHAIDGYSPPTGERYVLAVAHRKRVTLFETYSTGNRQGKDQLLTSWWSVQYLAIPILVLVLAIASYYIPAWKNDFNPNRH